MYSSVGDRVRSSSKGYYASAAPLQRARVIDCGPSQGVVCFSWCYHISEYHTQLAKMSFDEIFDLTAGVYFNFYNMYVAGSEYCIL